VYDVHVQLVCLLMRRGAELCLVSKLPAITGLYNQIKARFQGVSLSGLGVE
jgi:hypothetical protein